MGPHPDQSKTKQLQNQGKKINLSLSEMAQFFMKMANAIKAKQLAPGKSIPGCNSCVCRLRCRRRLPVRECGAVAACDRFCCCCCCC
jgi:hypothetical protein